MTEVKVEQMQMFSQDSWFGKTCPEHSQATAEKTSELCWKKLQGLQKLQFLFLNLTAGNGQKADASSGTDFLSHGELMTLNIGEYPNVAVESRLSLILEDNPHQKYCLSAKACRGILNRAEKRGKELPEILRDALIKQAAP